ncbi:MAG: biopolymer transporter ExbD [Leptolyngbya sp.]|nr:biopolymer transporter ExbD [Leptolyngbya sp.]
MRFKNQSTRSQLPEVNLVPMMDVLMTVLTFFIMISMGLTGQPIPNVNLPQAVAEGGLGEDGVIAVAALVVGLDQGGNLVLDDEIISWNQLDQAVRTYLTQNPEGRLVLKADRTLAYRDIAQILADLRTIGGHRVSLAVE